MVEILATLFRDDIVLNQEAFQKASDDLAALCTRMNALDLEIEEMLNALQKGFDCAEGRKFISSCSKNLRIPIRDQKAVLEHVSETLLEIRDQYYSHVFTGYESLNQAVKGYGRNS